MIHLTQSDSSQPLDALEKFANIVAAIRDEYLSETQNYPWIVGFSGGKDSTLVAHPDPFTIQARGIILQKLLETQAEYGEPLISEAVVESFTAFG